MSNHILAQEIAQLISNRIKALCFNNNLRGAILNAIKSMTPSLAMDIDANDDGTLFGISSEHFQISLSKINEKEQRRKKDGVYYTPSDVVSVITANSLLNYISDSCEHFLSCRMAHENINELIKDSDKKDKLFRSRVFDPTCGTGEFLVETAERKIALLDSVTNSSILSVAKTIYGNDISSDSITIAKLRLFFVFVQYVDDVASIKKLSTILNKNFTQNNFVDITNASFSKFDIILGNPPYVENRIVAYPIPTNYGNIYANVIENSTKLLSRNGVMGFIIPLSYVSTKRMEKIREHTDRYFDKSFVVNFADRPDCLFNGVHQKLTILIGVRKSATKRLYTSSYVYWYKEEREMLFDSLSVVSAGFPTRYGIPKLGNDLEVSIFKKIIPQVGDKSIYSIADVANDNAALTLWLNMRACFWMKAFTFNPGSNEYKPFRYNSECMHYIHCLLNSSLFFFHWIAMSDCWHITTKELAAFKVCDNFDYNIFKELSSELEQKLESTKVYIGTKQSEYAYKHKCCKDVIDKIDDELAKMYGLTETELMYIKNYKLKYRLNDA